MKIFNLKNMKTADKLIVILFFIVLILVALPCCNNGSEGQIVYLENGKIKLGFDRYTGALVTFGDLVNSYEFLDKGIIPGSLWEVHLLRASDIETIDNTTSTTFNFSQPSANVLVLSWEDFTGIENKEFQIIASIRLDEQKALSSWKISVVGSKGMKIAKVVFPKISGLKDPGEEYLAVPIWMGELIKDPRSHLSKIRNREKRYEWSYPGTLSLQCLALYNTEKIGFYASCNDSLAFRKSFALSLDAQNNLNYNINHYPSLDPASNSYSPPYEALIGSFRGDWITAAEQYREWASKKRWCSESRFKNGLSPKWLEETALWIWNRSKSPNVLTPALDLKERLNLPVNVFWHWWHGCSYDDGFPEYFPPREGKESFTQALSAAQDRGIRAIVYMNVLQWGDSTKSWKNENASSYSVKDINGEMKSHVYNKFTGKSLTNMCIATKFWRDKYASLCDTAINTYQINGIYMDQTCLSRMCYDITHDHPLGGGNYWVNNFAILEDQIRSRISSKNQPVLAGEGCGEVWLPYLDVFLALQVSKERYAGVEGGEPIPFFQAVYHQYGITYGNYSSLLIPPYDELWPKKYAPKNPKKLLDKGFNKQFLMEQARSFVWGMQPTIANYQSLLASERTIEIAYLLKLAKVRYQALKYLLYGKFLRSPDMNIPREELKISRLSIYAGRTGETVTTFHKKFSSIYSGTWKSNDGQIGIALASISDDPFPLDFSIRSSDYDLPPSGKINIIDEKGSRLLTTYSNEKIQINSILHPKGLCLIEIVPDI